MGKVMGIITLAFFAGLWFGLDRLDKLFCVCECMELEFP